MKTKFKNKAIVVNALGYEEVLYDIGTDKFCTQFDGKGSFTYFHFVDNPRLNVSGPSYFNIFVNDELIPIDVKKKVINIGRTQRVIYSLDYGKIIIDQFGYDEFIFNKISFKFSEDKKIDFVFDYTRFKDVPELTANVEYKNIEENYAYYVSQKGNKGNFSVCISFTGNTKKMVKKTSSLFKVVKNEYESLEVPTSCDTDLKKTLFTSSMFTALENYKVKGEYKAFTAGVNYLAPFRTYFRDSYWTTLCLYKNNIDLVKQQILTLAKGINEDGECPSAVKSDYTGFWGGHYDSPCFFVMMVSDYVKYSNNKEFLKEVINDKFTIEELCKKVIDRLLNNFTDKTHLLVKKGNYNRLDWADAVNRQGYVTYDEALYYRSLLCLGKLLGGNNKYLTEAEEVKKSINKLLWDDKRGYYVNYIDGSFVEINLSIDTILTVLFNIVPNDKKSVLVDNFEKLLYSKNHKELKDFGVITVYPTYKNATSVLSISGQAYRYHNGANWPYWAGMFAYMLMREGRNYEYALTSWFTFGINNGCFTPLEYLSPYYKQGSNLQAWSATSAFALQYCNEDFFLI